MPRVSQRRRFIDRLRRKVTQRQSLLAMQFLSDDSSSSGADDSSSSSSNSTTDALIFAVAYESSKEKLKFAEKKRYLLPRGKYRKSNEEVFKNDLNTESAEGERPWMTEEEFKQKYRVGRDALDHIYEQIKDHEVFKNKRGPKQMHPKHQLMVLLQYLGTEGSGANNPRQRAYFHIGRGSTNNVRKRARDAILSLGSKYYYWPDANERKKIAEWFRKECDLPNCVGIVDGTLFPLEFQPETEDFSDYHGRKFQWSLTCLVVSDEKKRIRWYIAGYPGSAHDNRMWRRSPLKLNKAEYFTVLEYIIGDTAFDPSEVMAPAYKALPGCTEPVDPDERLFNKVISKPRVSSEHVNGMWKGRFPWLRMIPMRIKGKKTLKNVLKYIHCTAILHNLLIDYGDQHMECWEREEDKLSDIADPERAPSDDDDDIYTSHEELMLNSEVPEDAPKDYRRMTIKEYLRENHANFLVARNDQINALQDDDVDMDENSSIDAVFDDYYYNN